MKIAMSEIFEGAIIAVLAAIGLTLCLAVAGAVLMATVGAWLIGIIELVEVVM